MLFTDKTDKYHFFSPVMEFKLGTVGIQLTKRISVDFKVQV